MFVPSQYLDLHDLISSPFGDLSRFVGIAVLVHCHEFIAVLVHCHELIAVLVHCHELITVLVHCHEMINTKILHCRNISKFYRKIVEKETKCIYLHIYTNTSMKGGGVILIINSIIFVIKIMYPIMACICVLFV